MSCFLATTSRALAAWPGLRLCHTPSLATWHPSLKSAIIGYAPSAHSSSPRISKDCGNNIASKHARKHETHPARVKYCSVSIQTNLVLFVLRKQCGRIYKRNAWYKLSCVSQTYCSLSTNKKQNLLVIWQFSETYGATRYGSSWRKNVLNQWLESGAL